MRPAAATPGASAALHVYISDPALFEGSLRVPPTRRMPVGPRHGQDVEVEVPLAYSEAQARRELEIYLATWQAMNPGVEAYIVDRAPS